jgi:hypothetical protein
VNVENNQIWAELKDETDRFALLSAADFHWRKTFSEGKPVKE